MNPIRLKYDDEPAGERRSSTAPVQSSEEQCADATSEFIFVVGSSMFGKGMHVNTGDLSPKGHPKDAATEVRATIVAKQLVGQTTGQKSGNSDGAKGGRKVDSSANRQNEPSSVVPEKGKQEEETLFECMLREQYNAKRGVWSAKMLNALDKAEKSGDKGIVWFSLIDKVFSRQTLELAWEQVLDNAGACGVDNITVGYFQKDIQRRLLAVEEQLKGNTYQPKPVKRVLIPKPGSSEKRPLGIPTVVDRVVQGALKMVIEPIFEKQFAPQSYGFRPGRGCKDALRRVHNLLKSGLNHVVDVDFKAYFDSIPHDKLMKLVHEHVADGRVLGLVEAFLKQGIMQDGKVLAKAGEREEGTPQGGIISPLLANIYLNPLDWKMKEAGFEMVRYADDMVILCADAETAAKAYADLRDWSAQAGLTLHPEKTKLVDMGQPKSEFDFLGYKFYLSEHDYRGRLFIRSKSLNKFKASIKPITKRTSGQSMETIIQRLKPMMRGFYAYFKHAKPSVLKEVDGWVRGRLRSILRKRRGGRGKARGKDHQRWRNDYFTRLGFWSLKEARDRELESLKKAKTQTNARKARVNY
jgi:RNA-directed DNA polymerase